MGDEFYELNLDNVDDIVSKDCVRTYQLNQQDIFIVSTSKKYKIGDYFCEYGFPEGKWKVIEVYYRLNKKYWQFWKRKEIVAVMVRMEE